MAKLNAQIGLDASQFNAGLNEASNSLGNFSKGIISPMALAGTAIAAVGAAVAGVGKGIKEAAGMEDLEMSFVTLLGSSKAAKDRLQELNKFAAETPFDLPGIGKASKVLQSLTGDVLSTGEGLRMVGDMAAMSGQPIEDLSVTVGRLYSGLQSGKAVGEAMARLTELGLMSSETRTELEKLQVSGKKGDEVWQVAAKDFSKYAGEMERKSKGWNGMMSTLADGINMAFAALGQPVMDALKPYLSECISLTDSLVEVCGKVGKTLGDGVAIFTEAWKSGDIGSIVEEGLKLGLFKAINAAANLFATSMKAVISVIPDLFKTVISADFWKGIANLAIGAFNGLAAFLIDVFKTPIDYLNAGIRYAIDKCLEFLAEIPGADMLGLDTNFKAKSFDEYLTDAQKTRMDTTAVLRQDAEDRFSKDHSAVIDPLGNIVKKAFNEIQNSESVELIDTKKSMDKLREKADSLKKAVEDRKKQADEELKSEKSKSSPQANSLSGSAGTIKTEGDNLSKIGGYIGFKGGSAYDHQKRTADNTEKLYKETQRTNKILESKNAATTASCAWG